MIKHKFLLILVFAAFLFHLLIIIPSGSFFCHSGKCGYFFWGAHGHDAIWHLALAEVAFKTIPFRLPIFSGDQLGGYNFLMDMVLFLTAKIKIPPLFAFFKIFPILWFFLFTSSAIRFGRKLKDSPLFVACLLFFLFFGGSFGYLLTLYHDRTLRGSESILAMQSGHMLLNVQFAFSLIVLLEILNLLFERKTSFRNTLILGLLIFLNFGLKFYAGIVSLFIASVLLVINAHDKKSYKFMSALSNIAVLGFSVVISVFVFYNPLASIGKGSVFILSPFAHVHSIIEEPKMFYLKDIVNARYFLSQHGYGPRLLAIELFSLFLYVVFNLGTRIFGIVFAIVAATKKKLTQIEVGIILTIIFSILLTTLFIQKGEWWNTVQFFYYAIFLSNIFAAKLLYNMIGKMRPVTTFVALVFAILTIPINVDFVSGFARFPAPAYLSVQEITALKFLKKQPDGVVLSHTYNSKNRPVINESDPLPLPIYSDTAYVAAFSSKQLYIADQQQLNILRINYEKRLREVNEWNCNLIGKIQYIYEVKALKQKKNFKACKRQVRNIFENQEVSIYKLL